MDRTNMSTPEARALKRAKYLTGLLWHFGTFIVINTFFWLIDIVGGGGVEWAYWIAIPWGLGLSFHGLAYVVDGRGMEDRKYQEFLEEERSAP